MTISIIQQLISSMLLQKIVKNVRMMVHMHVGWMARIADIKYHKKSPSILVGDFLFKVAIPKFCMIMQFICQKCG